MLTIETLRLKDGGIQLPKKMRKAWKGAQVMMRVSSDTVLIKKMRPSSFWESWDKMRELRKGITRKDINEAIEWARAGRRKK